jgi:glycosyltransferase involved in cell wall biosynthesis
MDPKRLYLAVENDHFEIVASATSASVNKKLKVGLIVSHPIQYQVPWFRELSKHVELTVYFACQADSHVDEEFGFTVKWDTDLVSGYDHMFLKNISNLPSPDRFGGCDTPEIASIIKSGQFDAFIVSGWYLKSYLQAALACYLGGVPLLVRGDSQLGSSNRFRFLKGIVYPPLLRMVDGFLSVGVRFKEYLQHFKVPESRIFFVPHCVDNENFSGISGAVQQHDRGKWLRLLFVGKLIPKKRPLDLVEALSLLQEREIDAQGVFVGTGELEDDIRQLARELCVNIEMMGFVNQSELPKVYVSADLLVLPSDYGETWGLVVNESMACGLPAIVAEAVGSAPDLVDNGLTGLTYAYGDVNNLAEQIEAFLPRLGSGEVVDALREKMESYSIPVSARNAYLAVRKTVERRKLRTH